MMLWTPFKLLRIFKNESEVQTADSIGISRLTLRSLEKGGANPTVDSLQKLTTYFERELLVLVAPDGSAKSDRSVVAVSIFMQQEGFDSWPIHLFNFVDHFRKTFDVRLILLGPVPTLDQRLTALLASTVLYLCDDLKQDAPAWAKRNYFLERPWFPAETESLKALALRDSSWAFRKNNIFVLDNFLARA